MLDPFKIFAEDPGKRETLKLIWPDLHAVLNKHVNDARRQPPPCVAAMHSPQVEATGRLTLNGTPACAAHIRMMADRDLGYPLDIVDPREWQR